MAETLFDELGGMQGIERVHRIFYDKLLMHPWLKGFFDGVPRPHLESQQTEFMAGLFGGPKVYGGRPPATAHVHMFITEEVFFTRHILLEEALDEARVREDLKERWLDADMGMKRALVKDDISECEGRYKNEPIIAIEKPR
ncbi:MAG: group 1 truncated hemoglobin [Rhodospirillaceae bacterium]|jgi:hemoglobin|nr:group 1 truncated hemoglobin [Rhodospirillaceae bacterium]MBT4487716.1 group 1 truncated hemoglobin [Rhodospirillaceae bacterium]MBT5195396.1 group 1 truncated hemoglobin [Rhodospirillaceae bacterium]MBT5899067.1 group 1 truncated hemoglobin [Rhodospirillaceae bacterium]MBT6431317.1 group 1 truncated hemoglobin [Rhodospirillaceae bacterium]